MSTKISDARAQFEAWYASLPQMLIDDCDESYTIPVGVSPWDAWQAALASAQPSHRRPGDDEEVSPEADTYWAVADMIEPHVKREGVNPDGDLPASVHDSVQILLDHWLRTKQPSPAGQGVALTLASSLLEIAEKISRERNMAASQWVSRCNDLYAAAAELRALAARQPEREVPDGVWEALQRIIENSALHGPASNEDAILVARYRRDLLAARQPVGENPAWRDELVREAYNRGLAEGLNADRQPVAHYRRDLLAARQPAVRQEPDEAAVDELRRFVNSNVGTAHGITRKQAKEVLRKFAALYAASPAQALDLGDAEPMFYIQDTRQFVGNCPMWWGPNGSGYVTRLDEAGRYTEQEAINQNRTRDTDVPWPCAEIDALARKTVDCQHMRTPGARLAELALIESGKAVQS